MDLPPSLPAPSRSDEPLRSLLAHARESVPFYAGAGAELADFPIVSKAIIRRDWAGFISTRAPCDRRSLIAFMQQSHPRDCQEVSFDGNITVDLTSGSSGLPFSIPRTKAERLALSFHLWQFRKTIDPLLSPAQFYGIIHGPKSQVTPGTFVELEAHLARAAIRWFHAFPAYLDRWVQDRKGRTCADLPALRFAENTGAFLSDDTLRAFEQSLGVEVINQYGCREVSVIGYARRGHVFQPLPDNIIVEILDDDGRPLTALGRPGRVVVTGLHQRLLPFIRYDTGDLAEIQPDVHGRLGFVLHEGRPHHRIHGGGPQNGLTVFKSVMIGVYKELGLVPLDYLQIRQLTLGVFQVVISPSSQAEALRAAIARNFLLHEPRAYTHAPEFRLEQTEVPPTSPTHPEKPTLFTNKYFLAAEAAPSRAG